MRSEDVRPGGSPGAPALGAFAEAILAVLLAMSARPAGAVAEARSLPAAEPGGGESAAAVGGALEGFTAQGDAKTADSAAPAADLPAGLKPDFPGAARPEHAAVGGALAEIAAREAATPDAPTREATDGAPRACGVPGDAHDAQTAPRFLEEPPGEAVPVSVREPEPPAPGIVSGAAFAEAAGRAEERPRARRERLWRAADGSTAPRSAAAAAVPAAERRSDAPPLRAEPVAPAPAVPDAVPDDRFAVLRKDESSIAVSVSPDGMGPLEIEVVLDRGVVNAHVTAFDPAGRAAMERSVAGIVDALAREGIRVGGFSVSLGGRGKGAPADGSSEGRGPGYGARIAPPAPASGGPAPSAGSIDIYA